MSVRQKLRTLLGLLVGNCNVYLCMKPESRQNPVEKLRTATARYFLYNQPAIIRIPVKILAFVSWPFIAVRLTVRYYRFLGRIVKRSYGIGALQQFADMLCLAWFEFIHPRYYYQYRLFDKARWQKRGAYLLHRRNHSLFAALNSFASGDLINNKEKFAEFCVKNDLPSPQTLAVFENGKVSVKTDAGLRQQKDIVVKPVYGHMGRDIRFAYADPDGSYRYRGKKLTLEELLQQIAVNSVSEPFLAQQRLHNHPELCRLSNGYLASIRIVTFWGRENAPAFLGACLALPYEAVTVSNDGRNFPVDLETGEILVRSLGQLRLERERELAEAGRFVAGNMLPFWWEIKELVYKAHCLLPDFFSLGWDVAITEHGPVILETNIGWNTDLIQCSHDLPLGDTEFARCALTRLSRLK
jgi:hypothetical protein